MSNGLVSLKPPSALSAAKSSSGSISLQLPEVTGLGPEMLPEPNADQILAKGPSKPQFNGAADIQLNKSHCAHGVYLHKVAAVSKRSFAQENLEPLQFQVV